MLIKRRHGWELPEAKATPESHYLQRRELVRSMGLGMAAGAAAMELPATAFAEAKAADPPASIQPSATTSTACRRP